VIRRDAILRSEATKNLATRKSSSSDREKAAIVHGDGLDIKIQLVNPTANSNKRRFIAASFIRHWQIFIPLFLSLLSAAPYCLPRATESFHHAPL
jgi:hypothetical protein